MLNEFKLILKNRKLMISLLAISLVSTIYVAMFVGSVFNPYGRTENLKISIVNHDKSESLNDRKIAIGHDLVDKLKNKDSFKFQEVSEKMAKKQLETGQSSGTIIIPENASKNATTLLNKHPKKINLEIQVNPGASYTGSQVSKRALDVVSNSIKQNIRYNYLDEIFNNVNKSKSGNQDISDALDKMSQSESKLISGNNQVTGGLNQITSSEGQTVSQVISGNQQITNGLNQLQQNNDELKLKLDNSISKQEGTYLESNNKKTLNDVTKVTENNATQVDQYGETIVPYMAGVSLFVAAISICAVYPFRKTITKETSVINQLFGKFLFYIAEGSLAALLMSCFVIFVFKINVDNVGQFILISMLWGIAAISITSFLGLLLDKIGLFLSMIMLVFQLSSSEGMFPIELSPRFFQIINPFSPMSYVIQGYREAMFTHAGSYSFTFATTIIIIIILVMMLLQFLVLLWFNTKEKLPFAMEIK
ncbi:YhgE/Pip family protein [Staphylococcus sp. ACRSN]|uniref:YhgE/Pip family protein n=1 Tax=Staphylococcus sp. ACRSN TaxID=2918214 RepID=UPI001EF1D862|nr:YhgE/Pip family protein [Staphylococcus sp. ACRSN]MCG7339246.1 YhgE/Pip family protein [Staphylococcus sp. ACRSN]